MKNEVKAEKQSSPGRFECVNLNWRYQIDAGPIQVAFDPQPEHEVFLAHTGKESFRLLKPEQLVSILNEACQRGLTVGAVNLVSGQVICITPSEPSEPSEPSNPESK